MTPIDSATGEVLGEAAEADVLAHELAAIELAAREHADELERLGTRERDVRARLAELVGVNGRADAGASWAVVLEGKPGRRGVAEQGIRANSEKLLALGLVRELEPELSTPTVAELEAARARIIAAGIRYEDLVFAAPAKAPRVELVPKENAA